MVSLKLIEKNTFIDFEEIPENKLKRNKSLYNLYTIDKTINLNLNKLISNSKTYIIKKLDLIITHHILQIIKNLMHEEMNLQFLLNETNIILQITNIIIKLYKNKKNVNNDEKDILKNFLLKLHDVNIKYTSVMIIFIEFMRFEFEPEYINLVIESLYKNNQILTGKQRLIQKIDINTNVRVFTKILDSVKLEQNNINNSIEKLRIKKEKIISINGNKPEIHNFFIKNQELIVEFINDQITNIENGNVVKYTINTNILKINKLYNIQITIPTLHFYIDYMSINFTPLHI